MMRDALIVLLMLSFVAAGGYGGYLASKWVDKP